MYSPAVQDNIFTRRTRKWPTVTAVFVLLLTIPLLLQVQSILPDANLLAPTNHIELPLSFVPNRGQTDSSVQYQAADMGGTLFFTQNTIVFSLPTEDSTPMVTEMQFIGANPNPVIQGQGKLQGMVNYLRGNDPALWTTDVPTYQSIVYEGLYPGIDLSYNGANGRLKGTYTVAPGADPGLIQWRHEGATAVAIDTDHNLRVSLPGAADAALIEQAPVAWQLLDGQRHSVDTRYAVTANGTVSFVVGSYNSQFPLIIDPTLIYSARVGGSSFDNAAGIALDTAGNVFITGVTSSTDFPTVNAYEGDDAGTDIFVAKVNAAGSSLIYSTYIGGNGDDDAGSIAVDANGLAYLIGSSDSANFPTINALQNSNGGLDDAVIVKLNASGNNLLISTYLGGSSVESGEGIAIDASNNIYVTGLTSSANFPTAAAADGTLGGVSDAFVTKMSSAGDAWIFSTYLGGSGVDVGADIALDTAGHAYVVGNTFSANFPTVNAYQMNYQGSGDLFVSKLSSSGGSLVYSTYLGGSQADYGYAIAVQSGLATVTGSTESTDFPLQTAVQSTHGGGTGDVLLTQLAADGQSLLFSTFLGGNGAEIGYDVAVDGNGNTYLTGDTFSTNFPTSVPLQSHPAGSADAFVARFSGQSLAYSTTIGGSSSDHGYGITTDGTGNAYVVGVTTSTDFPSGSALANSPGGETDVFIMKITDEGDGTLPPVAGSNLAGSAKEASRLQLGPNEELTFTIRLLNSGIEATTVDVSDALPEEMVYVAGSVNESGSYSPGTHTVAWENITVASGQELLLSFAVTADVAEPTVVMNTAVITPAGQTAIERSTAVLLTPETIVDQDYVPPTVTHVAIADQDVLTERAVTLHVDATDNVGVTQMFIVEWRLATNPFPYWQQVQSSGWVPYQHEIAWTLSGDSGTHFVAAWVSDAAKNISPLSLQAVDYASLLLPNAAVAQHDAVVYLVHLNANEMVTATLTPSAGDADLYVWYPGNFLLPDHKSTHPGTAVDAITFTAPADGPYLFLVYGYSAATYDLTILAEGGTAVTNLPAAQITAVSDKDNELTAEPVLRWSGLNPLGIASAPDGPYSVYLPILFSNSP